ncbi:ABC transporter ATP-binding protein [Sphingomonas koreensis]|nr:ABC transporter ATP-binding protein [Sphingomonas koreensis]
MIDHERSRRSPCAIARHHQRAVSGGTARRHWLVIIVLLGLILSFAEGLSLTIGVLAIYRILGTESDFAGDGPLGELLAGWGALNLSTLLIWGIALTLLGALLSVGSTLASERIANQITHRARSTVYRNYLRDSYQRATALGQGEMLDTLDYETPFLTQTVMSGANVIVSVCAIAVYGAYIMLLSRPLGGVALASGVVLAAPLGLASRCLSTLGLKTSALNERLLAHTVATAQGMQTIRLHAVEDQFIERYERRSSSLASAHVLVATAQSLIAALRQVGKLIALVLLVASVIHFAVPTAAALVTIALLIRLLPHLADAEGKVIDLFQFRAPLTILAHAVALRAPDPPMVARRSDGITRELRFERVSFSHREGEPLLRDASFTVQAGQLTTIRGPSGGGKTTLINLIARLFKPQGGAILVDGIALDEIDRQAWLAQIGFSGQDIDLQTGTILDNVRFFNPLVSEAVRRALGIVQASEFIDALPDGIHSLVGDRRLRLPGGQRQRARDRAASGPADPRRGDECHRCSDRIYDL